MEQINFVSDKKWKILKRILLAGTILAALKLIFVDYTLDEEYQIVMAYRNLMGDHLFKQMWEPHQTSAFFCSGLIWFYMAVTGTTTGVILFLRFVTLGVQLVLTYAVYKTLRNLMEKEYAFLLALLYLNICPKNIQIPEFSNMQLWFLTIPLLLMMKYYSDREQGKKDRWYFLFIVGISLSCEILTYPTCIILFPFFLFYIFKKSKHTRLRDIALLTGTCAACGILWLAVVLSKVSLSEFMQNIGNLLSFDLTHDVSGMTTGKQQNYMDNIILWGAWLAGIGIVSSVISFIIAKAYKRTGKPLEKKAIWLIFWIFAIVISEFIQLYYWVAVRIGYEYLQIHLLVILLAMVAVWKLAKEKRTAFSWGIAGTIVAYISVMYISDLAMYYTLPHGALGIVFAVAVLIFALQNVMKEKSRTWILFLVVSICLCSICGKGFTLRGGKSENSILAVNGIMKDGPAAGILADYMCAYIYNCNYEDYAQYVKEGDNVLIVANMIMSVGTTAYMFNDFHISHFSIVDPTTYDERLLTYWEQYPEKEPDVIVVDCWYGQLQESQDSWIMQYIENDFGYTSVCDGRYVRFYRR